jgi:hypothetical protein
VESGVYRRAHGRHSVAGTLNTGDHYSTSAFSFAETVDIAESAKVQEQAYQVTSAPAVSNIADELQLFDFGFAEEQHSSELFIQRLDATTQLITWGPDNRPTASQSGEDGENETYPHGPFFEKLQEIYGSPQPGRTLPAKMEARDRSNSVQTIQQSDASQPEVSSASTTKSLTLSSSTETLRPTTESAAIPEGVDLDIPTLHEALSTAEAPIPKTESTLPALAPEITITAAEGGLSNPTTSDRREEQPDRPFHKSLRLFKPKPSRFSHGRNRSEPMTSTPSKPDPPDTSGNNPPSPYSSIATLVEAPKRAKPRFLPEYKLIVCGAPLTSKSSTTIQVC